MGFDVIASAIGLSDVATWAVCAALAFSAMDMLTGFLGALVKGNVQSGKMREGLAHKGSFILLIILAWMCELFTANVPDLSFNVPLVIPVCVAIVLTEVVSILENLVIINPELEGSKIFDIFRSVKK